MGIYGIKWESWETFRTMKERFIYSWKLYTFNILGSVAILYRSNIKIIKFP